MRKIILFVFICVISGLSIGCASKPEPVVIDTGDIERLRYQYEQLRSEYDKLQQDYSRLVAENQFYADYYRNATAAIADGIQELGELGTDSANEIARIRTNIAILRNIINNIIEGEHGEGRQDTGTDSD